MNGETKRRDVLDYLKQSQNNIICLQDIHCRQNRENIYKSNWEGGMIIAIGISNSRGVAILFEFFLVHIIGNKNRPRWKLYSESGAYLPIRKLRRRLHINLKKKMIDILRVHSPGAFTCVPPLVDEDGKSGFRGNRGRSPPLFFQSGPPPLF